MERIYPSCFNTLVSVSMIIIDRLWNKCIICLFFSFFLSQWIVRLLRLMWGFKLLFQVNSFCPAQSATQHNPQLLLHAQFNSSKATPAIQHVFERHTFELKVAEITRWFRMLQLIEPESVAAVCVSLKTTSSGCVHTQGEACGGKTCLLLKPISLLAPPRLSQIDWDACLWSLKGEKRNFCSHPFEPTGHPE